MARASASKLARAACTGLQTARIARTALPSIAAAPALLRPAPSLPTLFTTRRLISISSGRKGITPDDKAPRPVETPPITRTPADISEGEYHTVADEYLDKLLTRLEQLQDAREDVDVEYSVRHPIPPSLPFQTRH